jgi:hypothetical protein
MAAIYLVSPDELGAHMGLRARRIRGLDLDPDDADIERLAMATGVSADRLLRLTFRDAPARMRSLINIDSEDVCRVCAAEARPNMAPRLRDWAYPFALWCAKHDRRLNGADMSGVDALGKEQLARHGAKLWRGWAMNTDATSPSTAAVLRLLLTPYRSPSPPAPWELAGASARMRWELQREPIRLYPRLTLSCVVPEYDGALPIYKRRLPEKMLGLNSARAVERRAVAIGVARVIQNPIEAAVWILRECDDFGRRMVGDSLSVWPIHLRNAIARERSRARRRVRLAPWRKDRLSSRALMEMTSASLARGSGDRFDHIARRLVAEHETDLGHLAVEHRLRRLQELALIELDDLKRPRDPGRSNRAAAPDPAGV